MGLIEHRERVPFVFACLAVAALFGGLLVGYEPVGGDPDRIFRPIKAELVDALRSGRLPYWSDRLGLGIPLIAESHVAAFYPPNWLLYPILGVSAGYRLSMWLHCIAIAAATFAYARQLGIGGWGSGLAAVSFPLCGFLTIHSSHEWAYQTIPYLPLCLLAAERYVASGHRGWLAALAVFWGLQIVIGHFQVQMWTGVLALLTGIWRVVADRRPLGRILGLGLGLFWGVAIAAVQVVPTWELAVLSGQTKRLLGELAWYSYPPAHWAELAVPWLFRRLDGGGEGPYWFTQQTTGFEACLFVGTIPLFLAVVGFLGAGRKLAPWRWIVPLSFVLATMPRWWPRGYEMVLEIPGFGLFRCPARYTAITSFGLALLAGSGLDRTISPRRFRAGMVIGVVFMIAAFGWAVAWAFTHTILLTDLGGDLGMTFRLGLAAPCGVVAAWAILRWRRQKRDWAFSILLLTVVEMGAFYYLGGSTRWGWSIALPGSSPVLTRLRSEPGRVRVGGPLEDLPVRAGLATSSPYIGFPLLQPNALLKAAQDAPIGSYDQVLRWLRRYGVTHFVRNETTADRSGEIIFRGSDSALDLVTYRLHGPPPRRNWQIVRLSGVFPEARVALRSSIAEDRKFLLAALSERDGEAEAWFLRGEEPADSHAPRARSARVLRWSGLEGEIEHDGTCDLILTRAHYPGWMARVGDGSERPVARADLGLIAVRLEGAGISRVSLRYRPTGFLAAAVVSAISVAAALGILGQILIAGRAVSETPEPSPEAR